ncbi:KH domain-containing protein [Candidatus Peregrinibacteria bacterium]|nr:KH domain-containing protein [Candidatus Peregrinibacteria bacterium]
MEENIRDTIEQILQKINSPFRKIRIENDSENTYKVNIESEEPSLLIGHHGENIHALQNIVKIIARKKAGTEISVNLDVDNYKKRQEDNVIELAERKVEAAKKSNEPQSLPPMSPYFRRVVHLYLAKKYEDIVTESVGEGDHRYLTIKPKHAG